MADVFERIEEVLGDVVELFSLNDIWNVRVVENGSLLMTAFPHEADAITYAEAQIRRLGLTNFIRL
ncbi:hypothetical protein RU07_23685 [Agrobacterium tumefaciens]|uniref:Uncharacterized protein n=1 Tax=Agrobacterium tumefaciens TaxID=358 RepID=A0A0D0KHV0_AGRTU|nr:hypothetical protein RU07_23685 [Agrobacterium tumefaciens]